jgi:hypothetical protein
MLASLFNKVAQVSIFVFLLSLTFPVYAQPGNPGDPGVPLGGIEFLIAAGALFGVKKWLDRGKKG